MLLSIYIVLLRFGYLGVVRRFFGLEFDGEVWKMRLGLIGKQF